MAASTPPGARYSLLAWLPTRCSVGQDCPLRITNTATMSTKTVRPPCWGLSPVAMSRGDLEMWKVRLGVRSPSD
jgi:hypothetical protein